MIDIGSLEALKRSELLELWRKVFKTPPSRTMGRNVMCGILGFEVQTKQRGGLDKESQRELKRYQTALKTGKTVSKRRQIKLQQGSRLIREWNGVSHTVEVSDHGYLWKGEVYRSLSSIAKAITGTHWSGSRFFCLGKWDMHSYDTGHKSPDYEESGTHHNHGVEAISHHHGLGKISHHHGLGKISHQPHENDGISP